MVDVTADDVVAAARACLDTPVRHRGVEIGVSLDCRGVAWRAGVDSGAMQDPGERFRPFAQYGRLPNPRRILRALRLFLVEIPADAHAPGDVVALDWVDRVTVRPMHLAVLAQHGHRETLIHADPRTLPKRVVEVGFSGVWVARAHSYWRYPALAQRTGFAPGGEGV